MDRLELRGLKAHKVQNVNQGVNVPIAARPFSGRNGQCQHAGTLCHDNFAAAAEGIQAKAADVHNRHRLRERPEGPRNGPERNYQFNERASGRFTAFSCRAFQTELGFLWHGVNVDLSNIEWPAQYG